MVRPAFPTPIRMIDPGDTEKGVQLEITSDGSLRPVGGARIFSTPQILRTTLDDFFLVTVEGQNV